jgi:hypothetical protein
MAEVGVQTSVDASPAVGLAGMPYDSSHFQDVVSCRAQEAIPFGAWVRIIGSDCELPDSSGEVTAGDGGVALATHNAATGGVGYAAGDIVPVMRVGRVWISTEEAIAVGAQPFIRFTANAGRQNGFLNTADTARAVQRTGVAMYRGVAAAGLGVLQINRV